MIKLKKAVFREEHGMSVTSLYYLKKKFSLNTDLMES